jgi:cell cycle checkpoint protein
LSFSKIYFDEYIISCESIKFAVNLTVLIDCLRLFGASENTTAAISYSNKDEILNISLEESGIVTTCEINSLFTDDFEELDHQNLFVAFRDSAAQCQFILKSDPLRESIQELNDSWTSSVRFQVSIDPAAVKWYSGGEVGSIQISVPRSSEIFVSFECEAPIQFIYPLRSMVFSMKALSISKEVYIRVNASGMMSVQHLVEASDGKVTFMDFLIVAEAAETDCDRAESQEHIWQRTD